MRIQIQLLRSLKNLQNKSTNEQAMDPLRVKRQVQCYGAVLRVACKRMTERKGQWDFAEVNQLEKSLKLVLLLFIKEAL